MLYVFVYVIGIINGMALFKAIQRRIIRKRKLQRPIVRECTCTII